MLEDNLDFLKLTERPLNQGDAGGAVQALDADAQRQRESSATSADSGVGLEAASEAAQVAEPQVVAEMAAPDEEELENTGEAG